MSFGERSRPFGRSAHQKDMEATCHADETQSRRRRPKRSEGPAQPVDGVSAVWPSTPTVLFGSKPGRPPLLPPNASRPTPAIDNPAPGEETSRRHQTGSRHAASTPASHRRTSLRGPRDDQFANHRRGARGGRRRLGPARQRAGAGRREDAGRGRRRGLEGPSMAQKGGAAVVPPQRQRNCRRRPRRRDLVGQGALEIRRLGRATDSRRPAFARCRAASCASPPISRPTSC